MPWSWIIFVAKQRRIMRFFALDRPILRTSVELVLVFLVNHLLGYMGHWKVGPEGFGTFFSYFFGHFFEFEFFQVSWKIGNGLKKSAQELGMLRKKFRFLGPCWVFLRTVWVGEAKKKPKIFLDLARKKLCHVVEHIFVSNFVMYFKIPSHHLGGDIWVWSFFFKRLFFRIFLGLCGPTGPIFTTAGGGLGV